MGKIAIERVSELPKLLEMKNIWNDILSESGSDNPFLSFEWILSWWEVFGKGCDLYILLAKEDQRIIGIAPFMCHPFFIPVWGVKGVEFIGSPDADYHDFIILKNRNEVIKAFILFVLGKDSYPFIRISELPEDSPNLNPLEQVLRDIRVRSNKRVKILCYYIPVDATQPWDNEFKRLKRSMRTDIKRQMNRFREKGNLSFRKITVDETEVSFPLLYQQHVRRWGGAGGESKFNSSSYKKFFQAVGERFMVRGWLDFSILECNGIPVSFHCGFRYKGVFYYYIVTYNQEFHQYSPGKIHLFFLLRDAHREALNKFDFLRGIESYKAQWTEHFRKNLEITIFKNNVSGIFCYSWFERIKPFLNHFSFIRILGRKWQKRRQ